MYGGLILLGLVWISKGKIVQSFGESVGAAAYNAPKGIIKGVYNEFEKDFIDPLQNEAVSYYKKTGVMPKFFI